MDLERLKLAKSVKPKKSRDKVFSGLLFTITKSSLVNKIAEETLFKPLRLTLFSILKSYNCGTDLFATCISLY